MADSRRMETSIPSGCEHKVYRYHYISQDRVWDEVGRKDKTENYIWPGDQVNKNHNDHRPLSI